MHLGWLSGWPFCILGGRYTESPRFGISLWWCYAVKIKRDPAARASFERSHPCPSNGKSSGACPGYVVDHMVPLKRGGADKPSNMQWQTKEAAKEKDRTK
jgi:hypothetical protein